MATLRERLALIIDFDGKSAVKGLEDVAVKSEGAGQATSRMGGLFDKITTKFPIAGKAAEKFGIDASSAGTLAAGAATATAAAVGAFAAKSVQAYQNLAGEVLQFQRVSGATAEESSKFVEVASDYGLSADAAAGSVGKFAKVVGGTPEVLAKYGVEIAKNKDGTTDLNGTLVNAAAAFAKTTDDAEKAALGSALFGKSWQQMIPLLEKGADGLKKSFDGVLDSKILSDDDLKQAEEFRLAVDDLKDAGEALMIQVGKGLVPVISDLAKEIGKVTGQVDKLTKPIGGLEGVFGRLVRGIKDGNAATGAFNYQLDKAAEKAAKAAEATGVYADVLDENKARMAGTLSAQEALTAGQEAAAEAADALTEAQDKQEEAAKRLTKATEDHTKAQDDDLRKALEAANPTLALRSAQRELEKSYNDTKKATDEAAKAKFEDAEKNAEVQEKQDNLVLNLQTVAEGYAGASGAAKGSKEWSERYLLWLQENRGKYGEALGPAIAEYDTIIARLKDVIAKQKLANQTAAGYFPGGGGSNVGPKREGATNGAFTESFGSSTVPVMSSASAAPVNITVNALSPQQAATAVLDAIKAYERVNGTSWRS